MAQLRKSGYADFTGCGNSLNVAHPRVLQLIMDSLRHFFQGRPIYGSEIKDLYWAKSDGTGHVRCLGMGLPGDQIDETGERGERLVGDTFVILFNAHHELISFRLGARKRNVRWACVLDTGDPNARSRTFDHMSLYPLHARSLAILRGEPIAAA